MPTARPKLLALNCRILWAMTLFVAATNTLPADYSYTLIVDGDDGGWSSPRVGNSRALNDNGEVAFFRYTTQFFAAGIYKGSGGAITTIAHGTAGLPGFEPQYFSLPGINNSGTVVFNGGSFSTGGGSTLFGIFTGDGGSLTTRIANFDFTGNMDPTYRFRQSSINDTGAVTFSAQRVNFPDIPPNTSRQGYYEVVGTGAMTLAEDDGSPYTGAGVQTPAINSSGQVAFDMILGTSTLLRHEPGSGNLTTLLPVSVPQDEWTLSDAGEVYFFDFSSAKVTDGLNTRTIADDVGPFATFNKGMISPDGDVAFFAHLDTNEFGIFTGPDAFNDRVIAHGDMLFGDTVVGLDLKGINRHGQVAFQARLQSPMGDLRSAVVVATRTPQPGDFNGDGQFNCLDVDGLVAVIAAGTNLPNYNLAGSPDVNQEDLDAWLALAGAENLPSGNPYRDGDANLDGVVDGSDFGLWNSNKFTAVAAWCRGDFSADGSVDGSDFGIWNANKFTSSDGASVVPEPSSWLGWVALLTFGFSMRSGRR